MFKRKVSYRRVSHCSWPKSVDLLCNQGIAYALSYKKTSNTLKCPLELAFKLVVILHDLRSSW